MRLTASIPSIAMLSTLLLNPRGPTTTQEIPVGGGKPQHEIYLALNPSAYSLNTYGRDSYLHVFPRSYKSR